MAFEGSYIKAKESGCEFSDIVLAFNLLESCNLSETDEKFILTAVDFKTGKEKKNMLEQVKLSVRKFQSRDNLTPENRVKLDEALVSNIKEALVSEGWMPQTRTKSYRDSARNLPQNSSNYKGKKNPLGNDG